ncbi:hypothetical protein OIV83_005754 [Microbotryomycetes sp. JL201]|nr:hypothetical protein OIV83_005754 [Microbotryomycetes sp. JL201]
MPVVNPTYSPLPYSPSGYNSASQFYAYYLGEHSQYNTRLLHLVGTTFSIALQTRALLGLAVPKVVSFVQRHQLVTNPSTLTSLLDLDLAVGLSPSGAGKVLLASVFTGYLFAWIAHFFVERNKPATFKHPFFSLAGDYRMWWEVVTGKRSLAAAPDAPKL